MRPGPPRGETAERTLVVTPAMSARVGGRELHPIYGTTALVGHVEGLCRAVVEPHLEADEDAVGAAIELKHRQPIPIGEEVLLVVTVASVGPDRLVCDFLVRHRGNPVARGSFEQRIVSIERFVAETEARRTPLAPA